MMSPATDLASITDPLSWLFALEQFGIKFGLGGIAAIVERLGHPERAFRSVHVAGTNGKGSVTAMVDAALLAAGHRSARYTSPHLADLTERFVIEGRAVSRQTLAAAAADVRHVVDELVESGALAAAPTFFEVTTAIAFELFRRAGAEIAVCEVGLGGRLDATNVLEPMACAITTIGFDHEQYLGRTLREIALEKAGIIKRGVPVVIGRLADEARDAVAGVADERQAPRIEAWDQVTAAAIPPGPEADSRAHVRVRTPARDYGTVELALAGAHQIDNAIIAVRLLELLDARGVAVPPHAIAAGLRDVTWPGRLEIRRLPDGREALLDAAHNADGAAALARFLSSKSDVKRPLVFAAMRDKNVAGMLRPLVPAVESLIVTRASTPRSMAPSELAERAREIAPDFPIEIQPSCGLAMAAAWRRSPRIIVAGSIFLLGDVLKELGGS
jgi:dihydrofolate synthase/folylpolyglutamate synthase